MTKRREPWEDIGSVALGVFGGIALAAILKKLMERECPYCHNINASNREFCQFCEGRLR